MSRIHFSVNGEQCSVGSDEVSSDVALVDYLREHLELRGTKYMCKEGGCGACVVAVTATNPYTGRSRTFSVNSCLVSVTQCQYWDITTVEGIGSRHRGYHPVQRALAEYNGTQCGYCSVGWVMSMYSLLESRSYDLTQYEIEDSFGSNVCRCTGYRPILDAFKSFATDAPKPNPKKDILDIEDLNLCNKTSKGCSRTCKEKNEWCWVYKEELEQDSVLKIKLKDKRVWYRVSEVQEIFDILNEEGYDSYMLVGGNTGRGAYHIFEFPRVLIDLGGIEELKKFAIDQNLIIGAGTTLTDLMSIFETVSKEHSEFRYLQKLNEHLNLVAHIPVRNVGTIAGNLMVKHRVPIFSSDVFLLLETVGALLRIVDKNGFVTETTPEQFIHLDMSGKVIVKVLIPPYSERYHFVSFKIMPRSQNAHAQINAAFLYEFDKADKEIIASARIVIGGLSPHFVHARETENFLIGKKFFENSTLQAALKVLEKELVVEYIAAESPPEYRRKVALGLFYKAGLNLIHPERLKPRFRSGARDFRKTRPVSTAKEVYDTNPIIWPITEPSPKTEALIQCSGEIKYVNDLPKQPQEVFAAFVTADIASGEIENVDPNPALKLPGVLAFISAKDIPGKNNYLPQNVPILFVPLELLCNGTVKYYDQAIGIIVAESEKLANRAALLVNITYKKPRAPPILTIRDARGRDPSRVKLFLAIPAKGRGADVQRIIKDTHNIYGQYHFSMETMSCVTRPSADGIDVFPSTQWPDLAQVAIAQILNIEENRINMEISAVGGSYGMKLSRSTQVIAACALVSYLLDRPCRMVLSIQANMRVVGKRLPCTRDYEVGVNSSGEIQYLEYHLYDDTGYINGDQIIALTVDSVRNCYDSQRWQFKLFNVFTDTSSNTWCRAPGTLEAIAMTEYVMEQISYELGRDPLEVRMNNINRTDTAIQELVSILREDSEYDKRKEEVEKFNKENRWKKKGFRIALMSWPKVNLSDYSVLLSVYHGDGTVVVRHGGVEVGQGINTKVIQVVAYTLNIPMKKVKVKPNDLVSNPNTFLTGGSSTTDAACFGAIKCCQLLLDRLAPIRATMNNAAWELVVEAAFRAGISLQTSYHTTSNDQTQYRITGAAVAEVELDILSGEHEVLRVDLIEDVGTSTNPEIDVGQVEGAFIMGMGYWTSEQLVYDQKTGELLSDRTWYYEVPMPKDIPIDFRVKFRRNSYNPLGVLGARAVAEPATCLAICVGFALREAIAASREDTGYPRTQWFNVDGPYSLEANVLKADAHLDEFLYN